MITRYVRQFQLGHPAGQPTWSLRRRTTCCHTFRNSSILTGFMRKSTAPCVTPLSTTGVSPLEDITAAPVTESADFEASVICMGVRSIVDLQTLTYHWQVQLQSNSLQQLEAIHICTPTGVTLGSVVKEYV